MIVFYLTGDLEILVLKIFSRLAKDSIKIEPVDFLSTQAIRFASSIDEVE
jgi:hypothetical protein